MNKKTLGILVSLLSVVMLVVPLSTVFATKPTPVNAVVIMMGPPDYEKQIFAGNNEIVRATVPFLWTGAIQGEAIAEWVFNFHQDGYTGRTFHTIESATVIVDGDTLTGSLTIQITISKGEHGTWRIIKGTEDLESLHGTGTWESIPQTPHPYDYAYSGNVHLDP